MLWFMCCVCLARARWHKLLTCCLGVLHKNKPDQQVQSQAIMGWKWFRYQPPRTRDIATGLFCQSEMCVHYLARLLYNPHARTKCSYCRSVQTVVGCLHLENVLENTVYVLINARFCNGSLFPWQFKVSLWYTMHHENKVTCTYLSMLQGMLTNAVNFLTY